MQCEIVADHQVYRSGVQMTSHVPDFDELQQRAAQLRQAAKRCTDYITKCQLLTLAMELEADTVEIMAPSLE